MKRLIPILICAVITIFVVYPAFVHADELSDLEKQLQETRSKIAETEAKLEGTKQDLETAKQQTQYYKGTLSTLSGQLAYAQSQLDQTELELEQKKLEIEQIKAKIEETRLNAAYQEHLLKTIVRKLYMSNFFDDVTVIFSDPHVQQLAQVFAYRQSVADSYRTRLDAIISELSSAEGQEALMQQTKDDLEQAEQNLLAQKSSLEQQIASTQTQLSSSQSRQADLASSLTGIEKSLTSLTQKEKEILQAKAAAALASTTVGDEEIYKAAIEKEPPATGTYFSFWTYGYPHRVGMSQYGAYGRSKAGQTAKQIITAYFSNTTVQTRSDLPDKITIDTGSGTKKISFEDDYLKGIGEMPSCWGSLENGGLEALKAQVIAARSYAMAYTNMGASSICTTQACQVYVGSSKITGTCGEYWDQAVEETRGQVAVSGGQIISAWYASTAGGFTLSSEEVWGSPRSYAQGIADLDAQSYPYDGPRWGNSPWYYKAWGSDPWLSGEQVADLFNASLLPDAYDDHLPAPSNGGYTSTQIVQALQSEGIDPVGTVTYVEVFGTAGENNPVQTKKAKTVRVYYGNGLAQEVSADRFRFVFNLRSPGTDAVWTSRYDVEVSNN